LYTCELCEKEFETEEELEMHLESEHEERSQR